MEVLYERCCGIDVHKSSGCGVYSARARAQAPEASFVALVAQRESCVNSLSGSGALTFDMLPWSRQAFIGNLSGTCSKSTSIWCLPTLNTSRRSLRFCAMVRCTLA